MYQVNKIVLAMTAAGMLALAPIHAQAAEADMSTQLTELTQEGKVWTVIALDRHLNPFGIDVDVKNGTATLTGSVESDIDRDLAEQLALGTEGVNKVNNKLTLDPPKADQKPKPSLSQQMDDATLTAMVKSKLLWNSNTEGTDINVTTEQGVVSLKGVANSDEARELAGQLASNTKGVKNVDNQLNVSATATTSAQVQQKANTAGTAINDAWITSKVKSSLVYASNINGLDISVETKSGMVFLSGSVLSSEEKQLAIETVRNIRGVRGVDADAISVDS